jgi:hypothetical protein
MEASKLFTGEAIFRDSSEVTADVTGDPDTADFCAGDGGPQQRP